MEKIGRVEFFERLAVQHPRDIELINWAYWIAKNAHSLQKRDQGERYFEHCKRVALRISQFINSTATEVILALLHDCIEDTFIPESMLRHLFYDFIADALNTLSKFSVVYDKKTWIILDKQKKTSEEYFKAIAIAPLYVVRVKCVDRLDNIGDMTGWNIDRIRKYIYETEEFVLPLASIISSVLFSKISEEVAKARKKYGIGEIDEVSNLTPFQEG